MPLMRCVGRLRGGRRPTARPPQNTARCRTWFCCSERRPNRSSRDSGCRPRRRRSTAQRPCRPHPQLELSWPATAPPTALVPQTQDPTRGSVDLERRPADARHRNRCPQGASPADASTIHRVRDTGTQCDCIPIASAILDSSSAGGVLINSRWFMGDRHRRRRRFRWRGMKAHTASPAFG